MPADLPVETGPPVQLVTNGETVVEFQREERVGVVPVLSLNCDSNLPDVEFNVAGGHETEVQFVAR
ncbi:MAG: hypothetical protein OXI66_19345 [Boseongicola sp.]|nr:hypothetical protein [Boseongicola sp.]